MSLNLNVERPAGAPSSRSGSATSPKTAFVTLAVLFAIFCAYDYSSYGGGHVRAALIDMQRSFQGFVYSFKVRM